MLIADIKGKLSLSEKISEDFLTSAVFSAFKYIDTKYLNEFLGKAKNANGDSLKVNLSNPEYVFWPWHSSDNKKIGGAEPDVVIYSQDVAIIIESKNYAGKSGSGIINDSEDGSTETSDYYVADQLAREYNVGMKYMSEKQGRDFCLIYLTRDAVIPVNDIEESIDSVATHWPEEKSYARNRIYWVNWQAAFLVFERILSSKTADTFEYRLCSDVVQFLERRDLDTFAGFDFSDFHLSLSTFVSNSQRSLKGTSIFFTQLESKYWESMGKMSQVKDNLENLFYSEIPELYWDFLKGQPELRQPNTVYYDTRE